MREEGVDIADPTVDADGNLVLGGGPRPGAAAPGAQPSSGTGAQAAPPDRAAFQAAMEKCGQRPQTAGGFTEADRQARQDAALKMAQCLRGEGLDVPDPDFSGTGPGGAANNGAQPAAGDQPRGLFGNLDRNDPEVAAAFAKCQAELGSTLPVPGAGRPATTNSTNG
jgi:hypothetical protein